MAETIEDGELVVAVPARSALADRAALTTADLVAATWVASPAARDEPVLGVWPGLPGRPTVGHRTADWHTKLGLVAAGAGVTTVPANLVGRLPAGVVARPVEGPPPELRRIVLARWPGRRTPAARAVAAVVREVAAT